MIQRNILFLVSFLTISLSSCALIKQDFKKNKIEKTKIFKKNQITKVFDVKDPKGLGVDVNIAVKTFKQNKPDAMELNNYKKDKSIQNLKKNLYLNLAIGNSSLKNYDVYNTSTNEAIWDDRYTELGSSFEIGIGYDFGKIRTEISYAQEKGRFDEYLTYFDKSITKISEERGELHKDFYIINTYYDLRDNKKFVPYIGLGIGFVNSVQDSAPFIPEYVRQAFVSQLKVGLSYEFSNKNLIYIEAFKRDAKSHTTNDGLGTPHIYEAKNGFDSSGIQIGFRKII
jgi:opacity protein-like surface antigen